MWFSSAEFNKDHAAWYDSEFNLFSALRILLWFVFLDDILFNKRNTFYRSLCCDLARIRLGSKKIVKYTRNSHQSESEKSLNKIYIVMVWCLHTSKTSYPYLSSASSKFKNCLNGTKHTKAITMGKRNFFSYK